MYMIYVWLALIAAGLILEAVEAGTLVTIWFSVGAVIPLIMSFFGISDLWYIILQIIVFGIVTILCLIFLRRIAKRVLYKNNKEKTNMDLNIGKKFKICRKEEEISYIKINGVEFRAVEDNGEDLELGEQVQVLKVIGNKIIVNKINKEKGEN